MATHNATIRWFASPGENFAKGHYSRAHSWNFDGGAIVAASASPHIVPMPWADPDAVDPEEAFVASAVELPHAVLPRFRAAVGRDRHRL